MEQSKDVNLFIKVAQRLKGKSSDCFELFTTGKMKKEKEKWIVEYENEYNGFSKIFLFDNRHVEIIASGDISYDLKLSEKGQTKFSCNTKDTFSYFSVKAQKIYFNIDENGGEINLKYLLEIDDIGTILDNKLKIELKKAQ